jgi:hypothetical protein
VTDEDVGDNDSDKCPRMYGHVQSPEGLIEVTVQGSETETTAEIEGRFHDAVDHLASTQREIEEERGEERGYQ